MTNRFFQIVLPEIIFHHEKSKHIDTKYVVLWDGKTSGIGERSVEPYQTTETKMNLRTFLNAVDVCGNNIINEVIVFFNEELDRIGVGQFTVEESKKLTGILKNIVG